MISQISARLLSGSSNADYNSNGSSSNGSNNNGKHDSTKPESANSGYSADGSAAAPKTVPPVYIDFLDANKHNDGENNEHTSQTRSNRRKATHLSFTASRAMEDLKKGGLPIPTIRTEDALDLEGHKIDMSKVKLVMAKSVKDSPFLIDRVDFQVIPTSASEYDNLFAATYQSYEKNDTTQWDSSTSSVTSSESDDAASMPPPALVVPPLLEDAIKANKAMKNSEGKRTGSKRKRPTCEAAAVKAAKLLQHVTMNDALEASSEARVVTLSFRPFIVVHVNTAYTRLTGYSSAKVLGKPLQDCLGGNCKDWMKIRAPHPVAALHERVTPIRTKGNKHQPCKCQATLVGPQLEGKKEVDKSSVTHYAVSFLPVPATGGVAGSAQADKASQVTPSSAPSAGRPRQVMG